MPDNVGYTPGSGALVASDEVTYSGDTTKVQLVKPVLVTGTEGSKTLVELPGDATNGLDVDVTRVSGNVTVVQATSSNLKADANITNASLAVTQATAANLNATVVGSGNFTVVQPTAANLNATVSGTVTANAGTGNFTVTQATAANLNATVTVTGISDVEGSVAHDAIDSGNPLKVGTRARSAVITSVASDDRADSIGTLQGYLITYPYALPQSALTGTATSTGTGDTAVIAAQGAGVTINVTTITVYNDSTTNTFVNIKDGATTRLVLPAPAKGGAMVTLPSPLRLTANTALNFASATGVTTMYVSAVGFAGI